MSEEFNKAICNSIQANKDKIEKLNKQNVRLKKQNQQLKEALKTKSYCQYANKCNELYDCSIEEYETMLQSNIKLDLENGELQQRINEAIEYLKEQEDYFYNYPLVHRKHLLEILGDK